MDRETLLDLIPAYALGALDADEKQLVEELLAHDREAQAQLAEYQEITDLLVLAVPAQPAPTHLQADLRQRLAQQRAAPVAPPPAVEVVPRPTAASPLRRWLALAAILAVIFGAVAVLSSLQTTEPGGEALFSQLAARDDVIRVALVPGEDLPQLAGELIAVPDSTEAVIAVNNLPVLSEDETYQLWLAAPDGVISGGLFEASAEGEATYIVVPITRPVSEYDAFGVSREEAGGSPFPDRPAGTGVFRVPLST